MQESIYFDYRRSLIFGESENPAILNDALALLDSFYDDTACDFYAEGSRLIWDTFAKGASPMQIKILSFFFYTLAGIGRFDAMRMSKANAEKAIATFEGILNKKAILESARTESKMKFAHDKSLINGADEDPEILRIAKAKLKSLFEDRNSSFYDEGAKAISGAFKQGASPRQMKTLWVEYFSLAGMNKTISERMADKNLEDLCESVSGFFSILESRKRGENVIPFAGRRAL